MADDGHFSSEELDTLLGHADPAPYTRETVDESRAWAPLAAVQSFVVGHRVIASALALVLVAGGAGSAAALLNRPPAPSERIDATVTLDDLDTLSAASVRSGDHLRASLVVSTADVRDQIRPVALVGPGLDEPMITWDGSHVTTTNRLSCQGFRDLTTAATLELRVTSADPWGRTITEDLAVTGVGVPEIYDRITHFCLQELVRSVVVRRLRMTADASSPVELSMQNPTDHGLFLFGVTLNAGGQSRYLRPALGGGGAIQPATVTAVLLTYDPAYCNESSSRPVPRGAQSSLELYYSFTPHATGATTSAQVTVPLAAGQVGAALRAVAAPCAGAPTVSGSVREVSTVSASPGRPVIAFTLRAAVSRGAVGAGGAVGRWEGVGTARVVRVVDSGSRARVRLLWYVSDCTAAAASPPSFRVDAAVAGHTYAYRLLLNSAPLWRALRTVCDGPSGPPLVPAGTTPGWQH